MKREDLGDIRRTMALRMQVKHKQGADYNHYHPERVAGEVFYANMQEERFKKLALESKRRGIVAYAADGKKYEEKFKDRTYFPVFAHTYELKRLRVKYE